MATIFVHDELDVLPDTLCHLSMLDSLFYFKDRISRFLWSIMLVYQLWCHGP